MPFSALHQKDERLLLIAVYETGMSSPWTMRYRTYHREPYSDLHGYLDAQGLTAECVQQVTQSAHHSIVVGIATYANRNLPDQVDYFRGVRDDLYLLKRAHPHWPVNFVIAVNGCDQKPLVEMLLGFQREDLGDEVSVTVLHLAYGGRVEDDPCIGKPDAMNATVAYARHNCATVIGFMDDDVQFEDGNILSNVDFLLDQSRQANSILLTGSSQEIIQSRAFFPRVFRRQVRKDRVRGNSLFTFVLAFPPIPSVPLGDDHYLRLFFGSVSRTDDPNWRVRANPDSLVRMRYPERLGSMFQQEFRWELSDRWACSFFDRGKQRLDLRQRGLLSFLNSLVASLRGSSHLTIGFLLFRQYVRLAVLLRIRVGWLLRRPVLTTRWVQTVAPETKALPPRRRWNSPGVYRRARGFTDSVHR